MCSDRKKSLPLRLGGGNPLFMAVLLAVPAAAGLVSTLLSIRFRLLAGSLTVSSVADVLVDLRVGISFNYVLLPLFVLFLQNTLKNDLNVPFVVRCRQRREIWHAQSVKVLFYSLLLALFFTLLGVLLGTFFTQVPINWDSPFSVYYNATYSVNTEARLWHVVLAAFGSYALALLGTGLLFLLLWWALDHPVVPWLAILALQQMELSAAGRNGFSVLFGRTNIGHDCWAVNAILPGFAVAAVFCLLLYLVGRYFICGRKEFYR